KRNTKTRRARVNKRILGRSIDERSPRIESRKDFGHWECDLVLGHKTKDDDVLLTLCERKTPQFFMIKIEVWCNSLPRKILNYKTPEEYFDTELDRIYRRI
ncbi:IS30 family transposase, partial [Lactobacillus delbrueckii]|nr:IS30 family transposase [Lactobacillus delbrueckii]MCT3492198.1 IS30 family transposase [Lactobacillus delbrueckii]